MSANLSAWAAASGALITLLLASPVSAEVKAVTAQGFEAAQVRTIKSGPDALYALIIEPKRWWSDRHTFSGSAANLTLDSRAGGCFCETLKDGGSVQHMTVVLAAPGKGLRLRGALGTLQTEPVEGVMTFALKPVEGGTELTIDFAAGGYFRAGPENWAKGVDGVLNEQVDRLKRLAETGKAES